MERKEYARKKLIVIGAGGRGKTYADLALELPEQYEVVAVAEPIAARREYIRDKHGLPEERCFESWEPLLELPKMADAAIIATMDRDHLAPALAAIEAGYDLLLEKPIAPTPEECRIVERAAKKKGVSVLVCHVLRYTSFFRCLKKLIDDGELGRLLCIQHVECVGHTHQSHSFVRGNWGNSQKSSCMILQKSCHDMDILQWLIGKKCLRVQSFGSLSHFTMENAPQGAPERCHEGCSAEDTCPYHTDRLYMKGNDWFRTASTKLWNPTDEDVAEALRTTDYGRCVYRSNNDVVDHQVVNMEFEDDVTVSFTMSAFTRGGRFIRLMGTRGEIFARMGDKTLRLYDFEKFQYREIPVSDIATDDSIVNGHGGGDGGIMLAFYDLLTGKENPSLCDISEASQNHMIAFAAERSRIEGGRVVELSEFDDL